MIIEDVKKATTNYLKDHNQSGKGNEQTIQDIKNGTRNKKEITKGRQPCN